MARFYFGAGLAKAWCVSMLLLPTIALGQTMGECLLQEVVNADNAITVGELRARCQLGLETDDIAASSDVSAIVADSSASNTVEEATPVERRIQLEEFSGDNPFSLTAHKPNYFLPFTYTSSPNTIPFELEEGVLDNKEIQFQLSFKVLLAEDLFGDNGDLFVAYTNRSFWQAYNRDISAPFRETNHEPEVFLSFDNDWEIFGFTNVRNQFAFNHQSNGQSGSLSRSWNRLMATFTFERERFAMAFTPWYRIPEDDKRDALDPTGDDNPDITDYMGHFEWLGAYHTSNKHTFSLMIRDPITSEGKGAYEFGWSFPISDRVRGFVTYFDGYGESLIDYNVDNETIGIGFQLTDWL